MYSSSSSSWFLLCVAHINGCSFWTKTICRFYDTSKCVLINVFVHVCLSNPLPNDIDTEHTLSAQTIHVTEGGKPSKNRKIFFHKLSSVFYSFFSVEIRPRCYFDIFSVEQECGRHWSRWHRPIASKSIPLILQYICDVRMTETEIYIDGRVKIACVQHSSYSTKMQNTRYAGEIKWFCVGARDLKYSFILISWRGLVFSSVSLVVRPRAHRERQSKLRVAHYSAADYRY